MGRYELVGRLGEGAQGVVYLARDPEQGTQVAIKVLRAMLSEDEASRSRFLREVAAAKQVPRFCTAQLLDADLADAQPYIVSEYIAGPSLDAVVRVEGPRGETALERIAINTATALAGIHQAGVVHRDFKAANVLLGPDGPVVIDFGIAKALNALETSLTLPGQTAGTPAYMAPDQLQGETAGPAGDIFAWGVTMAYAATGTLPFGSGTIPTVIYRIINEQPQLDGVPDSLRALVAACLDKDASARPTARQIVDHLLGRDDVTSVLAGGPAASRVLVAPTEGEGTAGADATKETSRASFADATISVHGVPIHGAAPSPTVDPVQPVQPQGPSQSFDVNKPAAPEAARPSRPRRIRVWGAVAAVVVLAVVGTVIAKTVTAPSGGASSSLGVDADVASSAASTSPTARAGANDSTVKTGAGSPSPTATEAATTNGQQSTAAKPPTATVTPTASSVPDAPPAAASSPDEPPRSQASVSPTVKAAPNPYTAAQVCGAGYSVIDSHSLSGGTIYLLYNNSTGKNCVTTMRSEVSGKAQMAATLKVEGGSSAGDSGAYAYYAGPVALQAASTCVEWGGSIGSSSWTSGWSHCG